RSIELHRGVGRNPRQVARGGNRGAPDRGVARADGQQTAVHPLHASLPRRLRPRSARHESARVRAVESDEPKPLSLPTAFVMRSDPAALHERLAAYLQAQTVPTAERGPEFLISRNNGTLWLVRRPNGSVNWRTAGARHVRSQFR